MTSKTLPIFHSQLYIKYIPETISTQKLFISFTQLWPIKSASGESCDASIKRVFLSTKNIHLYGVTQSEKATGRHSTVGWGRAKGNSKSWLTPISHKKAVRQRSALPLTLTGIGCTFLWSRGGWRGWNRSSSTICRWREVVASIKKKKSTEV